MSYTLRQAADLMGLSTKTLRRKIAAGEIEATKEQGKYGEEYIIAEIPEQLLAKSPLTTGQNPEKTAQPIGTSKSGKDGNGVAADPSTIEPAPVATGRNDGQMKAKGIARDEALFADLFSLSNSKRSTGQKSAKSQPHSTSDNNGKSLEGEKQEKAKEATAAVPNESSATTGQNAARPLDSETTLHELLKLVRKLQEENATLHERVGELNATVQMLSSGRMLPMSIPLYSQAGKSWLQRLVFWRK